MNPSNLLPTQNVTMGCPVLDSCLGKTQFCLQLTLFAQLPPSHGGLSASSLYLHTEFPFPFRRLRHLSHSFRSSHANLILSNPYEDVYVQAVHDAHHLLDIMPKIECFVASRKTRLPVRLIVIDSIAALFRSEFGNNPLDLKRRSFLFFEISGMLKLLARKYSLAVVVTNQVADFMGEIEGINGMRVGSNSVNSRLFLSRNEEIVGRENDWLEDDMFRQTRRHLDVVFAPHLLPSSCEFVITKQVVFGVDR